MTNIIPACRIDGWTPARRDAFIATLADTANVRLAAAAAGMTVSSAYRLRNSPRGVEFFRDWVAVLGDAHATLHSIAVERVAHGTETPVWYKGEHVGEKKIISDRLLMYMLEKLDPDRLAALLPPEKDDSESYVEAAKMRRVAACIVGHYENAKARGTLQWQIDGEPDPRLVMPEDEDEEEEDASPEDLMTRHPSCRQIRDGQRGWTGMDMAGQMGQTIGLDLKGYASG